MVTVSMRRRLVACAGALFMLLGRNARADEVVGALELGLRHEVVDNLSLSGSVQLRLDEDFSRIERWMPEAAIGYEIIKPLTVAGGYRLIYSRNSRGDFEIAHRVHLQAALSFKLEPIGSRLKYRLRVQDRFERNVGEPTEHRPTLRNALELSYTKWTLIRPSSRANTTSPSTIGMVTRRGVGGSCWVSSASLAPPSWSSIIGSTCPSAPTIRIVI